MSPADPSKTLFVTSRFSPLVGGVETQSGHLARALAACGEEIDLLTMAVPGAAAMETMDGFTVHRAIRIIPYRGLWGFSHFLSTMWFLLKRGHSYRLALTYQFQAFHNPAAVLWGRITGRPAVVVGGCSGEYGDFLTLKGMASGRLLLSLLKRATAFVALSETMREEMVGAGLPGQRITVIPNGVDTSLFRPGEGERDGNDLVFIGRLSDQKGLPWLIEAMASLAGETANLTLRLLGEGPEETALRELAEKRGVLGRVHFEGLVSAEAVREALGAAAAVVQPSIAEGLSCSLLEAMAMECPIITTDIPANRQLISDGVEGVLVPARDAAALAAAIRKITGDAALARRMGRAARKRVEEDYSLAAVSRKYAALFDRVAQEGFARWSSP